MTGSCTAEGVGAAWHGTVAAFLSQPPGDAMPLLRDALLSVPDARGWSLLLDVRLLRLGRRIDAVLVAPGAIVVLRIAGPNGRFTAADRSATEDAALDLADFHAGCRFMPVLPILVVPNGQRPRRGRPLPLAGAAPVSEATRLLLPGVLRDIAVTFPPVPDAPPLSAWSAGSYRPVPALVDAACLLFARHDVTALTLAQAGRGGLSRTVAAVTSAMTAAEGHIVVFVTGAPGAGKTLCGLSIAFAGRGATFLTGNPTLVHVLREALVRDAAVRGMGRRAAHQRMESVIQALPRFRDHHVGQPGPPPERILVIDEAQRCWTEAHAVAATRTRAVPLSMSEPAHVLDIMGRRSDGSIVICLLGGGQEIHDGEGGLAEWGRALAARPEWSAVAPPGARLATDPRQRLPAGPRTTWDADLHLAHPVRSVHAPVLAAWVDAMLTGTTAGAMAIAQRAGGVPVRMTRCLDALRRALITQRTRRSGLVASSHARRLRAAGLGCMLPHQDDDAVARWFLDRWPDIRSSDALEVAATEFAIQGLELDQVGMCWDVDLIRNPGRTGWQARNLRGSSWTTLRHSETLSNRVNAYRVLLTRARFRTVIWVPRGDPADATRDPALYDAVADHLAACGVAWLDDTPARAEDAAMPEPKLL